MQQADPGAGDDRLDLTCYLHPGWQPLIRPGSVRRAWMDDAPEAFPHRCLPLNIANGHGWEIATPIDLEAEWNGGMAPGDVTVRAAPGSESLVTPVALFGQGMLTFHVTGLFRTPPGWDLWIGGPPNQPKDGIAALTGIVETDWSPFTFTMNWQFTRPHHPIRFTAGETFAFVFPLRRGEIERFQPRFAALDTAPELAGQFAAWSAARDRFHAELTRCPAVRPSDKWQKHYYRGTDADGRPGADDHRGRLRVRPFAASTGEA